MSLGWKHLDPFGIEVELDLARPLEEVERAELLDLFSRHHLIVARGQSLDRQQQNRLTRALGPLLEGDVEVVSNDPEVGLFGSGRLAFHSDLAFVPVPVTVGILHAVDVRPGGSATRFASGATAYRRLDPGLAERIEDLEVLYVFPHDQSRRNRLAELSADEPRARHRLVQTDERSGVRYLYLGEMQADSICGLEPEASEELLQTLFAVMFDRSAVYSHVWFPGDCVIWDNLAVQHGRDDVASAGPRTLQRTTAGTLGFFDQVPQFNFGDDGVLAKVT